MAFKNLSTLCFLFWLSSSIMALDMIGEFNGKKYWIDQIAMSHQEAQIFCRRFGWDLISTDSVQEFDYVKELVSNHTSANGYWTSAVVTDTFKWGNGEGFPIDLQLYPVSIDYKTCVVFWGPAMFAHPCEGLSGMEYYPLCQVRPLRNH